MPRDEAERRRREEAEHGWAAGSIAPVQDEGVRPPEDSEESEEETRQPFWTGSLVFGLVRVPVRLFSATRRRALPLRLVDDDGTPLRRRYYCPAHDQVVEDEEIVRGYEVEEGRWVLVSDEDLDALAPEKTQEIDLRLFVPLSAIAPIWYESAYYLGPGETAGPAYRLLARVLEEKGVAGIATSVLRDREHPVAVMAENGLLRAQTLRFAAELRAPSDVGLPEPGTVGEEEARALERELEALRGERLDRDLLVDRETERLRELIEDKIAANEDVLPLPAELEPEEPDVLELMRMLVERLSEESGPGSPGRPPQGRN